MQRQKKRVLVVGDLMLDRTWTVGSRADSESTSSQSHGGISPYFRNFPTADDFRPGGAGLAALAMTVRSDIDVHLLSARAGEQELDTFRACGIRPAEESLKNNDRITWHWLNWKTPSKPMTTIKWRFNSLDKLPDRKPFFFLRIDQDPPPETLILSELPKSLDEKYDAILIMDFAKQTISNQLLDLLTKKYPDAFFGVDTKRPEVLKYMIRKPEVNSMFGFLNRDEASNFFHTLSRNERKFELDSGEDAKMLFSENKVQFGNKGLAIKLDRQGAVVFKQNDGAVAYSQGTTDSFGDGASIGAGDFYAAGFITDFLANEDSDLASKNLEAMQYAYRWIKYCDSEFWTSGKYKDDEGTVVRELPWPQDKEMLEIEIPNSIVVTPEAELD